MGKWATTDRSRIRASIAAILALLICVLSPVAHVAAEEKQKTQYRTKKTYALSERVFKDFARVQEKTEASDWPGALSILKGLEKSRSSTYSSFEKANLWNYFGWVYYSLEDYHAAIAYYEKVLAEEQLSDALQLGTLYTLAQLKFVQEDYKGAIALLKEWMTLQPVVGAEPYALLAQSYYQLNEMKQALVNINKAITLYEEKGKIPRENWLVLQRAVYFELDDSKNTLKVLEKLVKHYPKAIYWKQLSGMFGQVGREKEQLHSLEVAYMMGALNTEKELLNLAYLFLGQDAPYLAAKVIDRGIKAGQIEETSENLETLAMAWSMSREAKKALPQMEKAASKSDKGDLYARLAGIYLENDKISEALVAGEKAFAKGGIKRVDQLHIVMGISLMKNKQYVPAIEHFSKAATDERSKRFADQWIAYVKAEKERQEKLNI